MDILHRRLKSIGYDTRKDIEFSDEVARTIKAIRAHAQNLKPDKTMSTALEASLDDPNLYKQNRLRIKHNKEYGTSLMLAAHKDSIQPGRESWRKYPKQQQQQQQQKIGTNKSKATETVLPSEINLNAHQTESKRSAYEAVEPSWMSRTTKKRRRRRVRDIITNIDLESQFQQRQNEEVSLLKMNELKQVRYLNQHTHFTMREIQSLQKLFRNMITKDEEVQTHHKSKDMDRPLFRQIFRMVFDITDASMLDHIFSYFDADRQGQVSETEWILGLSTILRGSMDEVMKYTFDCYDINGDGSLGRDEVTNLLQGCLEAVPGVDDVDADNVKEIADLLIKKLDTKKTGLITMKNFKQIVNQNDPLYLECMGHCLPDPKRKIAFQAMVFENYKQIATNYSLERDPGFEIDKINYVDPVKYSKSHTTNKVLKSVHLDPEEKAMVNL